MRSALVRGVRPCQSDFSYVSKKMRERGERKRLGARQAVEEQDKGVRRRRRGNRAKKRRQLHTGSNEN